MTGRLINPLIDGWQNDTMILWRKKLNLLRAGKATANLRIGNYGSSVDRGTDETAIPYNSQFQNSTAQWLARLLVDDGYVASCNNLYGSGTTTPADLVLRDSRFSFTGSLTFGSGAVPGGQGFTMSAAASFSVSSIGNCDTAKVTWRDSSAGRVFSYSIDGGATTNISSTGTAQYNQNVIALGSLGAHAMQFSWVSGGCEVQGIEFYDSTRKEITVCQYACNGFEVASLISENGAPNGGRLTFNTKYPDDLAVGTFGFTNSWRNSKGVTQTAADFRTWVVAQQALGTCIAWVTPPYDGGSTGDTANQESYISAGKQVCLEKGVAIIDWRASTGSFALATAAGFLGDNTHLTEYNGAIDLARSIRASLFP